MFYVADGLGTGFGIIEQFDLVPENDREHFLKIAKEEIAAVYEGNFALYRLRPNEFKNWQKRKT